MCGILFVFDQSKDFDFMRSCSVRALQSIAHRGPDESNLIDHGNAILGHRRLSIIDLKSSHQPMMSPDNRYSIVYNGEIYNYESLRESMAAKWSFNTSGDTEVLLAGILIEGERFLSKVQGMWAFYIWDSHKKKLFGARDRLGKKPFYYYQTDSSLYIASELGAIKQVLAKNLLSEDCSNTVDYFKYGFYMPGTTAYTNIKELKPGHLLNWEYDVGGSETRYWEIKLNPQKKQNKLDYVKLGELLTNAVKDRLVADVKVGTFLSGGIDSSLITALAAQNKHDDLQTFTIKFKDDGYDESEYALRVANKLSTKHYERVVDRFNPEIAFNLLNNHIGQPFGDSSILPTALISELAAAHVKVVLSGDGADELFSGYQRYTARSILRWYSRIPKPLRDIAIKSIIKLPELQVHHSKSVLKKFQLFLRNYSDAEMNEPYIAPRMFSDRELKKLLPEYSDAGYTDYPMDTSIDISNSITDMMYKDTLIYLPQDILLKVDRASMSCGLEARAPFLDSRVVEHAFSSSIDSHRRMFSGKQMLKKTFKDLLPSEIWQRRKQGFAVPVASWFRHELGDLMLDLLNGTRCQLNKDYILLLLENNKKKLSDEGYRLWTILSYLIWKNSR